MGMTVEIILKADLLLVQAAGDYSLVEMSVMSTDMLTTLLQHPRQKCLIDCRQVTGTPSTIERFLWVESIAKGMDGMPPIVRRVRFAFVGSEPLVDARRFGEAVAVNRGIVVMVTESMDEALRWLASESS